MINPTVERTYVATPVVAAPVVTQYYVPQPVAYSYYPVYQQNVVVERSYVQPFYTPQYSYWRY